jgi:hypothetical protein
MSRTVRSVSLIRKTNISPEQSEAFLLAALELCIGSHPGEVDWQSTNKVIRGRTKGEERTLSDAWQPNGMVDVRRTRVESFNLNLDGELELGGSRHSFSVRGLPDEGSFEFRIDNTRLKGASMEIYATAEPAEATDTLFREHFTEA